MQDPKKLLDNAFICPNCGTPHFGTTYLPKKPSEEDPHIITCHGNEWTDAPSCGWSGPAKEGFVQMSREQKRHLDRLQRRDAFFKGLGRQESRAPWRF